MEDIGTHQLVKTSNAWSDDELERAVQVYLALLGQQLSGSPFLPNDAITKLHESALSHRTRRSVELRMKNISSVLYGLKFPLIPYWPPAHNVGTGVRDRIVALLYKEGISTYEPYAKTAKRDVLEERVTLLRKRETLPLPPGALSPKWETKNVKSFLRDPAVKAWVLKACSGICEGCKCQASFLGRDGFPYLEVHHVLPLSKNGSDRITNAVALCPNCHMRCHYSMDQDEFRLHLYETVGRLMIEVLETSTETTDVFVETD